MRFGLVALLVALACDAAPRVTSRACDVSSRRSDRGGVFCGQNYAQFEFAPASGAGMGAACACTTPTGARGEALTFARNSVAYCTKGNTLADIANGDLVECAANQPRVMPGGDGTGALGLDVWGARTNEIPDSQALNAASWLELKNTGTVTVTANAAVAPDGTTTADRLEITATTGAQYAGRYYSAFVSGDASASVYLKGNGTSGTLHLGVYDKLAAAYVCATCTYVAGSWTRCMNENVPDGQNDGTVILGNMGSFCGGVAAGAQDVFVWQVDWQVGATMSPPIKSSGGTASRVAEVATFPLTLAGTTRSLAATYVPASRFIAIRPALLISVDADNDEAIYSTSAGATSTVTSNFRIATVANTRATTAAMSAGVPARMAGYYDGVSKAACLAGACLTTAASLTLMSGSATVRIGRGQTNNTEVDGTIKQVCVDPNAARCL